MRISKVQFEIYSTFTIFLTKHNLYILITFFNIFQLYFIPMWRSRCASRMRGVGPAARAPERRAEGVGGTEQSPMPMVLPLALFSFGPLEKEGGRYGWA